MQYLEQGQHFGENKNQFVTNDIILSKAHVAPTEVIPWHYHENAYFLYNLKGNYNEVTKKRVSNIISGSLLFHHVQEPHYNKDITTGVDFFHLELTPDWFKKYNLKPDLIEGTLELKSSSLKSIFNKLNIETGINDNASKIAIDSLVLQAFCEIIRNNEKNTFRKPSWTSKITEIICDENWEKLSLTNLAHELNLHPAYLSRKFPIYFNKNLGDYIRSKKLERAAILLQNQLRTNSEIAYDCGFSDESHFIKLFKATFGYTPNQYRKLLKKG